jgi:hypothetical protein
MSSRAGANTPRARRSNKPGRCRHSQWSTYNRSSHNRCFPRCHRNTSPTRRIPSSIRNNRNRSCSGPNSSRSGLRRTRRSSSPGRSHTRRSNSRSTASAFLRRSCPGVETRIRGPCRSRRAHRSSERYRRNPTAASCTPNGSGNRPRSRRADNRRDRYTPPCDNPFRPYKSRRFEKRTRRAPHRRGPARIRAPFPRCEA